MSSTVCVSSCCLPRKITKKYNTSIRYKEQMCSAAKQLLESLISTRHCYIHATAHISADAPMQPAFTSHNKCKHLNWMQTLLIHCNIIVFYAILSTNSSRKRHRASLEHKFNSISFLLNKKKVDSTVCWMQVEPLERQKQNVRLKPSYRRIIKRQQ